MPLTSRRTDRKLYFGVICKYCGEPILFGVDISEGNSPMSRAVRLILTCAAADCGRQADYDGVPVSRYRKNAEQVELVADTKPGNK